MEGDWHSVFMSADKINSTEPITIFRTDMINSEAGKEVIIDYIGFFKDMESAQNFRADLEKEDKGYEALEEYAKYEGS